MRLVFNGKLDGRYEAMMFSFMMLAPLLVGMVAVYVAERKVRHGWGHHLGVGALANVVFTVGTLAIGLEGLICVIIALPMFATIGAFGGLLMGAICRYLKRPRQTLYGFALLPLALGAIENPNPEGRLERIERRILIAAPPAEVWRQLMTADAIRADEVDSAWTYRIGVPKPLAGVVRETPTGLVREVTMGKGIHFQQMSTDWQPQRYVNWRYHFDADSVPAGALDDHVRIGGKYFDLLDTAYTLTPRAGGTELSMTLDYRVSTAFDWYAAPLGRWLLGGQSETLLAFYRRRAEARHRPAVHPAAG
ncbi:MAG: SRPBCC domain-containing protein [Lysobacter sp.]|nr:SRPBCC domain-containing protein [Lysobacter sp.]